MSCPPVAFCSVEYLNTLKSLLRPEGSVLVINISARDQAMADIVFQNVLSVFGSVLISTHDKDDDDDDDNNTEINVTLLATVQESITLPSQREREERIESILSRTNEAGQALVDEELMAELKSCSFSPWEIRSEEG